MLSFCLDFRSGGCDASLLRERQEDGGDQESESHRYEERKACHPGDVPALREQGLQDRQRLAYFHPREAGTEFGR